LGHRLYRRRGRRRRLGRKEKEKSWKGKNTGDSDPQEDPSVSLLPTFF